MADEEVLFKLGLKGQRETVQGFQEVAKAEGELVKQGNLWQDAQGRWRAESGRFASTNEKVAAGIKDVGGQAKKTGLSVQDMGAKFAKAKISVGGLLSGFLLYQGAQGLIGMTAAGVKWGLSFNAQVESARQRFKLFTDDVSGLTAAVQGIDRTSQFNFGDLSDVAAQLGNAGVAADKIPQVLQGIANAAAASGKGTQGLQSIGLAISQIASKGRLAGDEIEQLNEAGAPGATKTIAQAFNLTAKQLNNLAGNGIDATKAIQVLTNEWTSGRMANAAKAQLTTLGGQWQLFTGNAQKLAGAATAGLAMGLEKNVLPAANRAVDQITKIFGEEGLTNEEKLRRARTVIETQLGPIWDDVKHQIDEANIPEHFGEAVGAALPKLAQAAAEAAPGAAKAFIDGWLHSGPWVQFLSVAYLAKKLGAFGAVGNLLGKGAGGGMSVGGKAGVVPVYVTNWGGKDAPGIPGGASEKGATSWLKRAAKFATSGEAAAGVIGGPELAGAGAGLGAAAAAGYGVGRGIGALGNAILNPSGDAARTGILPSSQYKPGENFATRTIRAPNPQFATDPFVAAPIQVQMMVNGQVVAQANTTAVAKQKARTK